MLSSEFKSRFKGCLKSFKFQTWFKIVGAEGDAAPSEILPHMNVLFMKRKKISIH